MKHAKQSFRRYNDKLVEPISPEHGLKKYYSHHSLVFNIMLSTIFNTS
jgi:hypothetical protein